MLCPKCKYERNDSDTAPSWQCPKCGIAIEKYVRIMEENDQFLLDEQLKENKRQEAHKKLHAMFSLILPIAIIIYFIDDYEKYGDVLIWFLFAAWSAYASYTIKSTGHFIGPSGTVNGEEHKLQFKFEIYICMLAAVGSTIMAFWTLLT